MKSRFLMILVVGMLLVPTLVFGGFIDNGGGGGGVTGLTSVSGTINQIPYFNAADTLAASELERTDANTITLESTSAHYRLSTDLGFKRGAAGVGYFTDGSSGHATGLGLGTTTPLSALSTVVLDGAGINIKHATGGVGFIAESTDLALLLLIDSGSTANQRVFAIQNETSSTAIRRYADNFGSSVDYMTFNLATDVVTLGSASVAGVNYISGTGNHTFSDGAVITQAGTSLAAPGLAIGGVGTGGAQMFVASTRLVIGIEGLYHGMAVGDTTNPALYLPTNWSLRWTGTNNDATGAATSGIAQAAGGVLAVFDGVTATSYRDLISRSLGTGAALYAAAPIGTVASGTGVTVNATGDYRRVINKVTLTYAAWAAAATTADKTIYTLAAKQRLVGTISDVTATFTGGAVSDADMTCGKTAGGAEYLASFDVDTAVGTFGLADADLGTALNRAAAIQGGDMPSWTATTAITCRLTTVGANTDALTAGSITFYLITEMM